LVGDSPYEVYLANWPSSNLGKALLELNGILMSGVLPYLTPFHLTGPLGLLFGGGLELKTVKRIKAIWDTAVDNADAFAAELASEGKYNGIKLVVGHSLGGRIALNYREQLIRSSGQSPIDLPDVITLAPAISHDELDFSLRGAGSGGSVEVFHSNWDLVLKFLFRLGQFQFAGSIGENGVPNLHADGVRNVDVTSKHGRKRRGHDEYEPDVVKLLTAESALWGKHHPVSQV